MGARGRIRRHGGTRGIAVASACSRNITYQAQNRDRCKTYPLPAPFAICKESKYNHSNKQFGEETSVEGGAVGEPFCGLPQEER
jgi:hypothetical protein